MYRHGLVTKVTGQMVSVQLLRHSACSNCGGCAIGQAESKTEIIKALNKANARTGEYVEIVMPDTSIANAALVAYGIPLVAMLGGIMIGTALKLPDMYSFGIGVLGLVGSYVFNRFILEKFRKKRKKYQVIATKIVSEDKVEGVF